MYKFITNVQRCLSSPSRSTIMNKKPIVLPSAPLAQNPLLAVVHLSLLINNFSITLVPNLEISEIEKLKGYNFYSALSKAIFTQPITSWSISVMSATLIL